MAAGVAAHDSLILPAAVLAAPRSPQSYNAIGDAITHAAALISAAPYRATERVIDVAGDGPDSGGRLFILIRPAPSTRSDLPSTHLQHERLARRSRAAPAFAHFGYVQMHRDRAW